VRVRVVNGTAGRNRAVRRRGFAAGSAVVLALAGSVLLSGCAPTDPSDAATEKLGASVVQTAERAASGDYAGAAASLDVLQARLTEYVEAGDIATDRSIEIQAAIDVVRADLTALIAAQTTPTPEPTEPAVTDPAPVETVPGTVESPPVDDDVSEDESDSPGKGTPGSGNSGNGNTGNGNPDKGKNEKD
jgi:hypothetical protein